MAMKKLLFLPLFLLVLPISFGLQVNLTSINTTTNEYYHGASYIHNWVAHAQYNTSFGFNTEDIITAYYYVYKWSGSGTDPFNMYSLYNQSIDLRINSTSYILQPYNYSVSGEVTLNTWNAIDITEILQSHINNSNTLLTFYIAQDDPANPDATASTKNSSDGYNSGSQGLRGSHHANAPYIVINLNEPAPTTPDNTWPRMVLDFEKQSVDSSQTGVVYDEQPSSYGFSTGLLNISIVNLTDTIRTSFNDQNGYKQFYEFHKIDNQTNVSEVIEILDDYSTRTDIRILSASNDKLENAEIRFFLANQTLNTFTNHTLIGQRLTSPEGLTHFFHPKEGIAYMSIYKGGYQTQSFALSLGNSNSTTSNPLTFYLDPIIPAQTPEISIILLSNTFSNRSKNIRGNIFTDISRHVQLNTNFRPINETIGRNLIYYNTHTFELEAGTHFNTGGTDDLIITAYADNYSTSITVEYVELTNILDVDSANMSDYLPLLFIPLLIVVVIVGFLLNNPDAGFHTFMIGGIAISFISTQFLLLSSICTLYYISTLLKKVVLE